MPGLGTKLFLQGDTLGADDVNGFFMSQVVARFATTAARDSAFGDGIPVPLGGSGKPLLAEGLICYIDSSNLIQFYDGSGWQDSAQFSIADGVVATAKIANNAITSEKIADGTIVNEDVNASAAIELGKLADATIDIKTANYPLVLTDKNKFIKMESASNRTITVPLQSTVNFPEGSQIHLIRYGSGTVQVVGETNAVILYRDPGAFLRAQYSSATLLKCAATNTWMLMGDLSAT